jgi:hypothetical protein
MSPDSTAFPELAKILGSERPLEAAGRSKSLIAGTVTSYVAMTTVVTEG